MEVNLSKIKKIHFTGIKGVGMTALALCAQDLRMKISGSDLEEKFVTDEILKERKIFYQTGFTPKHVPLDTQLLIYTAAHGGEANPEVNFAKEKGMPVLSHAQALGLFMKDKVGISTCGVGGKTSTAAILATVLTKAGQKPSFAIGVGKIKPLGFPGRFDKNSLYFIAEADEYFTSPTDKTPRFLYQNPKIIILTNLEYDHPDVYANLKATRKAFAKFINKLPKDGLLVVNADNKNTAKLIKSIDVPIQTFGFSSQADWQIISYKKFGLTSTFSLRNQKMIIKNLKINVPGDFNLLNAAACFVTCKFLGLKEKQIKAGLKNFLGTKRRFEKITEINHIALYDDYAHHPIEIKSTLEAAKAIYPKNRLVAIFQPHTYSRTKYLLKEFSRSFSDADVVVITKIYASAREKDDLGVSGQTLAQAIAKNNKEVNFLPDCQSVCNFLQQNCQKGDVIFTLGAGDIFLWHRDIIKTLMTLSLRAKTR